MRTAPPSARNVSYLVALLIATIAITLLFELTVQTFKQLEVWIEHSVYPTRAMRLQIHIARYWAGLWWLFSPLIVAISLGCAFLYRMMQSTRSK